MTRRRTFALLLCLGWISAPGCGLEEEGQLDPFAHFDSGVPPVDSGFDAPADTLSSDTSPPDAPPDVAADAPPDVTADAPPDVTADAPPDVTADAPPDVTVDAPPDVVADAPSDVVDAPPGPCTTPSGACLASVPNGWEVIALSKPALTPCPTGYSGTDAKADPAVGAGACDCDCTITSEPCVKGTLPTYYSYTSGGNCGSQGTSLNVNGTGCTSLGFSASLANYYKSPALPAGGTCSGQPKQDPTKLTMVTARSCVPPSACLEEICQGKTPAGLGSCIRAAGDVACPAGPFTQKTLVVADASFSCSTCPTCGVTAQCNNPTISFYSNSSCTSLVATLASNNTCVPVPTSASASVSYFKYSVDAVKSCTATGPKQATLQTQTPTTVCCRS